MDATAHKRFSSARVSVRAECPAQSGTRRSGEGLRAPKPSVISAELRLAAFELLGMQRPGRARALAPPARSALASSVRARRLAAPIFLSLGAWTSLRCAPRLPPAARG